MRVRATLLSLWLIAALPAGASAAASDASPAGQQELCFGQVPTIVGTPDGGQVKGTEGVDVVVTNGAYGVDLLGGDDLLCITGETGNVLDDYPPRYWTGGGNDRIDSSESTDTFEIRTVISLGPGSDEFIGGATADAVYANDMSATDPDADVIHTAGGMDSVTSGGPDTVDLGPNIDGLHFSQDPSGGVYSGGPGEDWLSLWLQDGDSHSWKLDNRSGRLKRDGEQVGVFTSFVHFEGRARRRNLVFVGSDSDETFTAWGRRKGAVVLRMNGGDDHADVRGGTPGDRFDGGTGTDKFSYNSAHDSQTGHEHTSIVFNLTSGLLRDTWPEGEKTRRALNFEKAIVSNQSWNHPGSTTIKGTSGANLLTAWGPGPITIYGKAGNDDLIAYDRAVLKGGRGHDIARAAHGVETQCEAEVTFNC